MYDVMHAIKHSSRAHLMARITSCIKYLIRRIFNNNLWYNITGIVLVWHSSLTKEN